MISQLLLYSLKAALTLSLLYVPYTLMLQRERFYRLNRLVLLGIIALSLVLPLCNVSWMSLDNTPIMQATHQQMIEVGIPVRVADDGITVSYQLAEEASSHTAANARISFTWFAILAIVFFVGMAVSVVIRCLQLGLLSYMMRHKVLWTKRTEDGIRICCLKGHFTPYSWMKTIFISQEDWDDGHHEIVLHETGHIRARHSWDMLLLMLCQALQWYNPFAWMIGHSLADVHEYEADDYVLRQGVEQRAYMMLLVKKVAQSNGYSFVNGLNKSTLNKRILMMKESVGASSWRRAKLLYLLPMCALVLSAFATPRISNPVKQALTRLEEHGVEKADSLPATVAPKILQLRKGQAEDAPLVIIDGQIADGSSVADILESKGLTPDMIASITVLKGESATSMWGDKGKNGVVVITTKRAEEKRDKTESDLLMENIVSHIPGATIAPDGTIYVNGKKVEKLLVDGKDQLAGKGSAEPSVPQKEVEPELEGGQRIYAENFRYPPEAQENGIAGEFMVDFYVEADGSVSDVKARKKDESSSTNLHGVTVNAFNLRTKANSEDLSKEEDEGEERGTEALLLECERVVKLTSGKWTPGYAEDAQGNRTPKRMKMSIPLTFRLS